MDFWEEIAKLIGGLFLVSFFGFIVWVVALGIAYLVGGWW